KYRTLSPEQEHGLLRRLRSGDPTARDPLIESRMASALARAKRAAGPNLPIDEACTVAKIAVIRAVDHRHPDQGDFTYHVGTCVPYALIRALNTNLTAHAKDRDVRAELRAPRAWHTTAIRARRRRSALLQVRSVDRARGRAGAGPLRQRMLALLPPQQRSLIVHRLDGGTLAEGAQAPDPPASTAPP